MIIIVVIKNCKYFHWDDSIKTATEKDVKLVKFIQVIHHKWFYLWYLALGSWFTLVNWFVSIRSYLH